MIFDPEKVQHRTVRLQNLEVRASEDDQEPPMIRGYAAVFNAWAELIPGRLRERIAPGSFRRTLRDADVRALLNHDPNYVLGRNKAGTLEMREDKHGLAVEIEPPDSQWARDLMVSMKRGDISQMSFGFLPVKWTEDRGDLLDVTLEEVRLFDVSVVTFPAYPQTEAWARSAIASIQYLLSDPSNAHSTEVEPPTTVTPDNVMATHSEPDPATWQQRAQLRAEWLESLKDFD